MDISEISVKRSYTINTGNFESIQYGASVTGHLNPGDDPDTAYAELLNFIETKLLDEIETEATNDGTIHE